MPISGPLKGHSLIHPLQGLCPMLTGDLHLRQMLAVSGAETEPLTERGVSWRIPHGLIDVFERHRWQPQAVLVLEDGLGRPGTLPRDRTFDELLKMADEQLPPR